MIQAPFIVRENDNTNQRGPMTTALTTSPTAVARTGNGTERKALIQLGDEQVAVRLDADGFLTRVQRKVRLHYGTELYAATPNPTAKSKVTPFQPGYMKLVAAMGGQLVVPPTIQDPITGERRANPQVELYPGTGIIRRVTATAVCAVRNPVTGDWHASVQSIIVDGEHVFRQALLKISRDDAVMLLSEEDAAALKAEGKLRGWARFPGGPLDIWANMANGAVREAYQTFTNQSATMRQRACSKAERLACDHNPIMRMSWEYSQLRQEKSPEGRDRGPAYVEATVIAWVENRGRSEMDAFVAALASQSQGLDGVAELVADEQVDDGADAFVDAPEPDPGETPEPETPDHGERPPVIVPRPEPEKVEAKPEPKPVEPTPPTGAGLTDMRAMLAEIGRLESRLTPPVQDKLRTEADVSDPLAACSTKKVRAYLAALRAEVGE